MFKLNRIDNETIRLNVCVCVRVCVFFLCVCVCSVHEKHNAKSLWEKRGAVVMVVRRPG